MSTISELAAKFNLEHFGADANITEVAIGTQHVLPGSLFIAVQGAKSHGLDFLEDAIAKGAVAVLTDRPEQQAIPTLYDPNPRAIAGELSSFVYGTSQGPKLFGVTGTNGKTSTVFYLAGLLTALGEPSGLVSSALIRSGANELSAELTTPEAPRLHQLLAQMRTSGLRNCAVEVSAQGLTRKRVSGLRFEVAGFTNLSRDHLDDYPDMESYLAAKAELFSEKFASKAVLMVEDHWAETLFKLIEIPKVGIGIDYRYQLTSRGIEISGLQELVLEVELPALMAKNLVLAVVMLLEAGYSPQALEQAAQFLDVSVPGRLQLVSQKTPHIYIDYAHTPAAIESAAKELRSKYPALTILLAASGDRDQGKRPEMALAAAKYASRILITDQHPRSEDPAQIRSALSSAIADFANLEEIADPAACIARAVEITEPGGAILWCGPGHLKYREVMGQKIPFDASQEARKVLGHD